LRFPYSPPPKLCERIPATLQLDTESRVAWAVSVSPPIDLPPPPPFSGVGCHVVLPVSRFCSLRCPFPVAVTSDTSAWVLDAAFLQLRINSESFPSRPPYDSRATSRNNGTSVLSMLVFPGAWLVFVSVEAVWHVLFRKPLFSPTLSAPQEPKCPNHGGLSKWTCA